MWAERVARALVRHRACVRRAQQEARTLHPDEYYNAVYMATRDADAELVRELQRLLREAGY